jgi:hypothetical protein
MGGSMSWEPVDIFVKSAFLPVEGVLVRVYDRAGTTIYSEVTTDAEGKASFLLPTGDYSVRLYKFAHSFKMPQHFSVVTPGYLEPPNTFDVQCTTVTPPLANDPRLCRLSGYFRDLNGAPKRYLDLHLRGKFSPLVLDGAAVVSETVAIRTGEDGYAQIDLIRCAEYEVRIESLETEPRCIQVPDSSSANLADVLFPVVSRVVYAPEPPVEVAAGESVTLTPTVLTSSGVPLVGTASSDVLWKTTDESIASVSAGLTELTVTGVAPGTTTLKPVRIDQSIMVVPLPELEEVTITVV